MNNTLQQVCLETLSLGRDHELLAEQLLGVQLGGQGRVSKGLLSAQVHS